MNSYGRKGRNEYLSEKTELSSWDGGGKGKKETFVTNILLQGMTGLMKQDLYTMRKCSVLSEAKSFTNEKEREVFLFLFTNMVWKILIMKKNCQVFF